MIVHGGFRQGYRGLVALHYRGRSRDRQGPPAERFLLVSGRALRYTACLCLPPGTIIMLETKLSPRGPWWKWWVCGLLLLATMINYMDRQTLAQLSKRIMGELHLDERDYGQLESAFAFAFAVGAIVFGWMADRWSVRWLYPAAVFAWSLAGFATGLASGFATLLACRFLLGLTEAGNWPCALRTTQRIVPPEQRSMANGILQFGAAFGAIVTPPIVQRLVVYPEANPSSWLAQAAASAGPGTWRLPFLVVGAAGVSWVALWLLTVRRGDLTIERRVSPSLVPVVLGLLALYSIDVALQVARVDSPLLTVGVKAVIGTVGIAAVARWLLRSTASDSEGEELPRPLFARRFGVLMVLVVAINTTWHFFRAWLPLFLQNQHQFTEEQFVDFSVAYYVATDVGSLAAGFITMRLAAAGLSVHSSRLSVFIVCAGLTALSVPAALVRDGTTLVVLLLVIGFAALGLFPNYYSFSQSLTTRHQGKLTGALGCINWLAMYVLQGGVGELVKRTGSYSLGVACAGLVPLIGVAVLLLAWGDPTTKDKTLAA